MRLRKSILLMIGIVSLLTIGCDKVETTKEDIAKLEEIENHIPYIGDGYDEIDNSIIDKRYETTNKNELKYNSIYNTEGNGNTTADVNFVVANKGDMNYKTILEGFCYFSEINPCNLTYNEALDLVKKILPDDIEKVKSVMDNEVNKEYIYYKSEKGDFRVGLCLGYVMSDEGEKVDDNLVVGIDYRKKFKE